MNSRLLKSEQDAATRPIVSARGLPGRAYTSPEWSERERDTLLANTWSCLMFADELAPRHALPLDFLGLPLIVVRAPGGAISVFHNVCRHRGHKLVMEAGDLRGGFVCPYHNWTYGFDGALKGTPHIGGRGVHQVDGFEPARHGLMAVRCTVWLGMVFINLSGDAADFDEYIAPLRRRWRQFTGERGLENLRIAPATAELTLDVAANWKLAVENYLESYHLPFVHPALDQYSKLQDHYNIMAEDWGGGQGSMAFNYAERAGVKFPQFPDWPPEKARQAEYIALYPNVLLGLQIDHAFAMILRPLAADRTVETVRLLFVGEDALGERYDNARAVLLRDWMQVFAEDIGVVEGMQAGRLSNAFDGGVFSPFHDEPTHHFHGWVARRHPVDVSG